MKKAQMRIKYNADRDEFEIWTRTKGETEWGFDTGCKCVRSEHNEKTDEPEYIHCSFVTTLERLIGYGYELVN